MSTPTHAGAVTFRRSDGQTFFLLVSSSDGSSWVLPKGHIESGETPEAAALRELQEEGGIAGELVERLSAEQFTRDREEIVVQYFLVRALELGDSSEQRSLRWEDEATAIELLAFDDARAALRFGADVARNILGTDQ